MEFNPALWAQGFDVQVIASNGSMVAFTSAEIENNDNMIVAYRVDGQPLASTQFITKQGKVESQTEV